MVMRYTLALVAAALAVQPAQGATLLLPPGYTLSDEHVAADAPAAIDDPVQAPVSGPTLDDPLAMRQANGGVDFSSHAITAFGDTIRANGQFVIAQNPMPRFSLPGWATKGRGGFDDASIINRLTQFARPLPELAGWGAVLLVLGMVGLKLRRRARRRQLP